eukprot:tig00000093_g3599.t1
MPSQLALFGFALGSAPRSALDWSSWIAPSPAGRSPPAALSRRGQRVQQAPCWRAVVVASHAHETQRSPSPAADADVDVDEYLQRLVEPEPEGAGERYPHRRRRPARRADPRPERRRGAALVLFRESDLRVSDHPALAAAAGEGRPVVPVFVCEPGGPALGGAARLWLREALRGLDGELRGRYGSRLVLRVASDRDSCAEEAAAVAAEAGAATAHFCRRFEPRADDSDARLLRALAERGVRAKAHGGRLLCEPRSVDRAAALRRASRGHFGSFGPFLHACNALPPPGDPLPPPDALVPPETWPRSASLDDLQLVRDAAAGWTEPLLEAWGAEEGGMGPSGAQRALQGLAVNRTLSLYDRDRGRADLPTSTSRLSPYLRFGQVSPREVHVAASSSPALRRRLAWRDLAYWQARARHREASRSACETVPPQLHHFPRLHDEPVRPHYAARRWGGGRELLRAWQRGMTGYPLVDAGMRELWRTGWMHQNVRMVAAAFLTEYLNIDWREGAAWFDDCLVDADLAINSMMWQNAGGSGLDQWGFDMHPVRSAAAIDPTGEYVRKWVPELAHLGAPLLFAPWEAPDAAGAGAYPPRAVVDLEGARRASREAAREARRRAGAGWVDSAGRDLVPFRQKREPVFTRGELRAPCRRSGGVVPAKEAARPSVARRGGPRGRGQARGPRRTAGAGAGAGRTMAK